MNPEDLRESIARKQALSRIMSGPNSCDEALSNWNDSWTFCPVCLCKPDHDDVWVHKDPEELRQ